MIVAMVFTGMLLFLGLGAVALVTFMRTRSWHPPSRNTQRVSAEAALRTASEAGLTYINEKVARVPWSIHVLKVDRSRKDLAFFAALADHRVLGVSLIADQARGVPPEIGAAVAGVNGDYYQRDNSSYAGDPRGLQIVNGELVSAPDTGSVWFDSDGNPHLEEVQEHFQITWPDGRKIPFGLNEQRKSNIAVLYTPTYGASTRAQGGREIILDNDGDGPWLPLQAGQTYRARVREVRTNGDTRLEPQTMVLSLSPRLLNGAPEVAPGAVLEIATATTPDLTGVKTAIGGGPVIIKDGKPFSLRRSTRDHPRAYSERSKYERHPRSAVGWSQTAIYLVVVDGRQPGMSVGMKLAELAEYMLRLGCIDGMAFDGGKSAQMWLAGRIMNRPAHGEDTVANSLLVVRRTP